MYEAGFLTERSLKPKHAKKQFVNIYIYSLLDKAARRKRGKFLEHDESQSVP